MHGQNHITLIKVCCGEGLHWQHPPAPLNDAFSNIGSNNTVRQPSTGVVSDILTTWCWWSYSNFCSVLVFYATAVYLALQWVNSDILYSPAVVLYIWTMCLCAQTQHVAGHNLRIKLKPFLVFALYASFIYLLAHEERNGHILMSYSYKVNNVKLYEA